MLFPKKKKTKAEEHRENIRNEFWPDEDAWIGGKEVGWFRAPRTLPLILSLLSLEEVRGKHDPTSVYLELWSRDFGEGVIMMAGEQEHAYAAGYIGRRGLRSWQERMNVLEKLGFIKTKQVGNQRYKYVLLIHPTAAVESLRKQNKITELWWDTYRSRQMEVKEASYTGRQAAKKAAAAAAAAKPPAKVVPLKPVMKTAAKKSQKTARKTS